MINNYLVENNGIEDRTVATIPPEPVERVYTALVPLFSSKGRDHTFIKIRRPSDYTREFGSDVINIDKYGQSGLNGSQHLRGGGDVIAYRLTAPDAERANMVLSIVRVEKEIPLYERDDDGSFVLNNEGNKVPKLDGDGNPINGNGFELTVVVEHASELSELKPHNVTGGRKYPIMNFWHNANGEAGNSFGVSVERDRVSDSKAPDGRRYIMYLSEMDKKGNIRSYETINFALNPEALFPGSSSPEGLGLVYPNVYNQQTIDERTNAIQLKYKSDAMEALLDEIVQVEGGDKWRIDPLFGMNVNGRGYDLIVMGENSVDLSATTSFLLGGHDGSLRVGNVVKDNEGNDHTVTDEDVENTKVALMRDFYNCDLNQDILNPTLIDSHIAYDANHPMEVKEAMVGTFKQYRPNMKVIVDCGLTKSAQGAMAIAPSIAFNINPNDAYGVVIVGPAGVTNEPMQEPKEVTYTYELARRIPENFRTYGQFTAPSGYESGQVKYMVLNWYAKITKDDEIGKLRDQGIWFVERVNDRYVQMIEETQYLLDNEFASRLKYFRYSSVVLDAMLEAQKIISKYPYDHRDAEASMGAASDECIGFFTNRYAASNVTTEVNIYRTKRDELEETARADVIFSLGGLIKKFRVTIIAQRA